jgi:two-component system, OmpR family, sensor histidine kinase QseC
VISIRRFLVIVLLATITLVNFLAALHGYRTSMAEAERLFDRQLDDIASVLSASAESLAMDRDIRGNAGSIAFQVWHSDELAEVSPASSPELLAPLEPGYHDVNFSGYRWRAFVRYEQGASRWLIVAQRLDVRFQLAESIIIESVLPILLGLPLEGLLIWFIVGRGLRPLRQLATEMAGKRSDDLSSLSQTERPKELDVLTDSINALLRRLDAAFDREKRFAADAAHELRTPLSVLKVQLHNLLRDSTADDAQLRSLQMAVDRMGHSVEQVLMLYRMTPDQFAAKFVQLDLAGVARQAIAELYPQIEAQGQQIELIGEQAFMPGDVFAVHTLLINLLDNASKYSGKGGEIRVHVSRAADQVILKVEDSGPGIPAIERERVFERFYRVGGDRHKSGITGSGIGLAIVRHIAEMHHAVIELAESGFGSGLSVIVMFPIRIATGHSQAVV